MQRQREKYTRKAQEALFSRIKRMQNEIYAILTQHIDDLKVNQDGELVSNITNIGKANRIAIVAEKELQKRSPGLIGWLIRKIQPIFNLNKKHFNKIKPVKESDNERAIRLVMARWGYDTRKNEIIKGGYFDNLTGTGTIKRDVLSRVNQALLDGSTIKDFRAVFRKDFTGGGGMGMLDRYFLGNTRDLFHEVDRQTQVVFAIRLKLNYALWSHTIIKTSTDECKKRSGLVYDLETILSWDSQTWPGKKGSYLHYGHGFGCRGQWNFMSNELAETYKKRGKVNVFNPI